MCANIETEKKVPRRRSLALLHKGFEVRGFAEPSSNLLGVTGNIDKLELLQPFNGFSPRRNRHKSRSLSLVTWDTDAKLSIDPSIIGSSIEAYLSSTDKLDKVDEVVEGEEQHSPNDPTQLPTRSTTKTSIAVIRKFTMTGGGTKPKTKTEEQL